MGAMRKMGVYLGLVEDDLEPYDEDPVNEQYKAAARRSHPENVRVETRHEPSEPRSVSSPSRTAVRPRHIAEVDVRDHGLEDPTDDSYRITTLHPRSYNDARRLGEEFRLHHAVIMNLTEMNDVDAKRLIDFSAGLVFGLHGSIERVTNKVFLLSPANVDVAAEARRLAQDGFFNQS